MYGSVLSSLVDSSSLGSEKWLYIIDMCCKYKLHSGSQSLSMKKENVTYIISTFLDKSNKT